MWKEIFIDEDIEKSMELTRADFCGNIENLATFTVPITKKILEKKTDCHLYYYEDDILEITAMYKYDEVIDRIVVFRYFFKYLGEENPEHYWNVAAEGCKITLERHGKICRISKFGDEIMQQTYGLSEEEYIVNLTAVYANHGIRVIEYDKYTEYELM